MGGWASEVVARVGTRVLPYHSRLNKETIKKMMTIPPTHIKRVELTPTPPPYIIGIGVNKLNCS